MCAKKQRKPDKVDLFSKEVSEFNKEHHVHLSYGQYESLKGGGTVQCPITKRYLSLKKAD